MAFRFSVQNTAISIPRIDLNFRLLSSCDTKQGVSKKLLIKKFNSDLLVTLIHSVSTFLGPVDL